VAIFAVGKDDARKERSKRGRKADCGHQEGNADDEQKRRCNEQFPQTRHSDKSENRPGKINAQNDHRTNRTNRHERGLPAVKTVNQTEAHAMRVVSIGGIGAMSGRLVRQVGDIAAAIHKARHGQKRNEGEHRNDGDVLKQKHGKAGLTAI